MAEFVNVEMPDGTIIEGVPEGTSQRELQAKLAKYKAPGSEALPSLSKVVSDVGRGAAAGFGDPLHAGLGPVQGAFNAFGKHAMNAYDRAAYTAGGGLTDIASKVLPPEGAAAVGFAGNVGMQAIPALMGGGIGRGAAPALEGTARTLMQSSLKPTQADRATGAADRAISTMLEEGISPTRGGMDKAREMASRLHETVNDAIAASPATVNLMDVGQRLKGVYEKALNQVNSASDLAAVKGAWKEFTQNPLIAGRFDIPVQLAQKLKSGTYESLGSKAYGELGSAATETQKQLARGLREKVAEAVPEVSAPLKKEAALMNVQEVAANRALGDANKNPLSLGTSVAAMMHDPLAAAGMWANASTPVKAMLARMLYSGKKEIPEGLGALAGSAVGARSGTAPE